MSLLSRIGSAVRSAVMRFSTRASEGWDYLSRRRHRDERIVGNGSGSSIVVAALGWIVRNLPEAPIRVQIRGSDRELEVAKDPGSAAFLELLETPNAYYDGILLKMAIAADYWIDGNAYVVKVRDQATGGRPIALWWIPHFLIEPAWPEDGTVFLSHYVYSPSPELRIRLEPDDVIHWRWGFDPDNIRKGRSPLQSVLREIYTDEEAQSYTSTILRNLGVPGIIISPGADDVDLEEEDAEAIKAQFTAQFTADRRGEPMVVGANAKVDKISFSPAEMDLRNLRRIPEERVSAVLGVPAIVAGLGAGLDRSTFANYAEAREAGYEENIIPTQRILAGPLRRGLLAEFVPDIADYVVDFDVSEVRVLQEDENKKWERGVNALSKGAILVSDFNRMVGLPVDDKLHDVYLRDSRIVAVRKDAPEAIGEEPKPEPEPAIEGGAGATELDDQGNPMPPGMPPGVGPMRPAAPVPGSGNGNGRAPAPVG